MNVDKLAMRYEQLKNKTSKHSFITLKDNSLNAAEKY